MDFKIRNDAPEGFIRITFNEEITPEDICEINKLCSGKKSDEEALRWLKEK